MSKLLSSPYLELTKIKKCENWDDALIDVIQSTLLTARDYYIISNKNKLLRLEADVVYEIEILLSDDAELQSLNAKYRHIDKATNILAFPAAPSIIGPSHLLGSLAISYTRLKEEAIAQEKLMQDHFIHLLVHGFLHLCGYDHEDNQEAEEMEAMEIEILAKMGIKNPYI